MKAEILNLLMRKRARDLRAGDILIHPVISIVINTNADERFLSRIEITMLRPEGRIWTIDHHGEFRLVVLC